MYVCIKAAIYIGSGYRIHASPANTYKQHAINEYFILSPYHGLRRQGIHISKLVSCIKNQNKRKKITMHRPTSYTGMTKIHFGEFCLRHFSLAQWSYV